MLGLVVLALFANSAILGQSDQGHGKSPTEIESAQLRGLIRNSNGQLAANVTVFLQANDAPPLTARTDSAGTYHFRVRPGIYILRAGKRGEGSSASTQFVLEADQSKTIDLTLAVETKPQPERASSQPEFFDEPNFTVAGVSDTTSLGGHGSQAVVRNRDSLAAETASLKSPPRNSPAESANAAQENFLRQDLVRQPDDFNTNYRLGKLLFDDARAQEAIPYLERASKINPQDFNNAYELALAYAQTGEFEIARKYVHALLGTQGGDLNQHAGLHHLLADIDEKSGDPLDAVREYQLAAELSPTETNYFDWGAELLLHRAAEPAIEVFTKGNRAFPRSARMLTGLGSAWYSHGSYDQGVIYLCEAADLNPGDPNPYLFMGKMQAPETAGSSAIVERLARFAQLEPQNALANYYYAVALLKQKPAENVSQADQVESLLKNAVRLDPKLALAYLELGTLYSERGDSSRAISNYQRAIDIDPQLEQAHYRLARLYNQEGEAAKAHAEVQKYEEIAHEKTQEVERHQRELQQFVYEMRDPTPSQPQ